MRWGASPDPESSTSFFIRKITVNPFCLLVTEKPNKNLNGWSDIPLLDDAYKSQVASTAQRKGNLILPSFQCAGRTIRYMQIKCIFTGNVEISALQIKIRSLPPLPGSRSTNSQLKNGSTFCLQKFQCFWYFKTERPDPWSGLRFAQNKELHGVGWGKPVGRPAASVWTKFC